MRIDGTQLASGILSHLSKRVDELKKKNVIPHLVVLLIGNDPASVAYVRQKKIKGEAIGMKVTIDHIPTSIHEDELLTKIREYNEDQTVHGVIVQQPLPEHIDVQTITEATIPEKDVDGFNQHSSFTPPIAEGVEEMLRWIAKETNQTFENWITSKSVTVIGKGETGGKPIIQKLREMGVNPNIIDSKTPNPLLLKKSADIIISCVGKLRVIKADELKKGVILFSIGMSRGEDGKLHGDYEENEVKEIASYYSPVPGGVGPMNVAMLLKNVIDSASEMLANENKT